MRDRSERWGGKERKRCERRLAARAKARITVRVFCPLLNYIYRRNSRIGVNPDLKGQTCTDRVK